MLGGAKKRAYGRVDSLKSRQKHKHKQKQSQKQGQKQRQRGREAYPYITYVISYAYRTLAHRTDIKDPTGELDHYWVFLDF